MRQLLRTSQSCHARGPPWASAHQSSLRCSWVARAQALRRPQPSAVIDATSPMCWDETETAAALAFEEAVGLR